MSRTKFPSHADAAPRFSQGDYLPAVLAQPGVPALFSPGTTKVWKRQRPLAHPQPNSHFDPVSIALTLDAILRMEHDHLIRARPLADLLNEEYPQVMWDAVTVGKILASIVEAAKASGAPENEPPLARGVTSGAAFFAVHPSVLNWRWLAALRHAMGARAEEVIETERRLGKRLARPDFPWDVTEGIEWGK